MLNISGFGTTVWLIAQTTYPLGFIITEFADDADPIDLPEIEIAELVKGVNGTPGKFSKPVTIPLTISLLPGSASNEFLQVLVQANLVNQNKSVNDDTITAAITYPNAQVLTLTDGVITSGVVSPGLSSTGRLKTMTYKFSFSGYASV